MGLLSYFKPQPKNGRKPYEHRPTFVPAWTNLPDSIRAEYESGETLFKLSLKYRASNNVIRQKLEALGATIRPKGYHGPNNDHPRKLDADKIAWILEQDSQDVPHAEIARQIGNVTRERIRQICLANGCATRKSRQTKSLSIKERRQARKLERQKTIQEWSDAWKSGASFEEMSALCGDATGGPNVKHGCSRMTYLRSRYPELFPHRAPNQWRALRLTDEQRQERMEALSRDWLAGLPRAKMAEKHGFKNEASVLQSIHQFRKKRPDLFPKRPRINPWIMRRKNEASRMKALSVQDAPEKQPNHL